MKDLLLNKAIDNSNKMKHDRLMVESVTVPVLCDCDHGCCLMGDFQRELKLEDVIVFPCFSLRAWFDLVSIKTSTGSVESSSSI